MSATRPVEDPGMRVLTTQPFETPAAGTATQSVEAPSAGPEDLLTSTGNAALHVDQTPTDGKTVHITGGPESDEDLQSALGSSVDGNFRGESPDRDLTRDESADQELSEEASYREQSYRDHLWAGIRSLTLTVFHLQMTTLLLANWEGLCQATCG